ncbi:toll-like receptor 4 isoform X1 [Schistocerca cancellata]|uniref:toll-like receptor 4 isoform X1 n=1 Tax=Schistocerca cancellata TaxID=274614 RepID=UPI0021188FA2|nr:toll-like receptor 4 isoform X1 [Schistocerca cancellata]
MRAASRALLLQLLLLRLAAAAAQEADYDYDVSQHQNCVPLGSRTVEIRCKLEGDSVAVCRGRGWEESDDVPTLRIGLRDAGAVSCASLLTIERGSYPICYERLSFRNFTVGWAEIYSDDASEDWNLVVDVNLLSIIGAMKQLEYDSSFDEFWNFTNAEFSAESGFLTAVTFNEEVVKPRPCLISLGNIHNLGGTSVEELSLYNNKVSPTNLTFGPMPKLRILRLVHCSLLDFPVDAHIKMPALEELDLADNTLLTVPAAIAGMKKLKTLNLSRSRVQRLAGQLPHLPQLKELTLRNTFLCCLHQEQDAFQGVPNLEFLDISQNQLTSLGAALRGLHQLQVLDASDNQLTEYPELELQSQAALSFAHNRLSTIPHCSQFGSSSSHLALDLHDNQISHWDGGPNILRCVDSLNLANNSLANIDANMLASLDVLKTVWLSENPLHCDGCAFQQFREWLRTTQVEVRAVGVPTGAATSLRCATPPAFLGMSVEAVALVGDLDECAADYSADSTRREPLLAVGLSLGAALLVLLSAAVGVCYRYRFELAYSAHLLRLRARARSSRRKGRGVADDVFLFDAFILYSGSDQSWVGGTLLPLLEGQPDYRVCLHERGLDSGTANHNLSHLMDCSRHVIIVLSKSFLSSRWCLWEMALANHRTLDPSQRDYVILLELEPLERSALPRQLRFIMDTRTYLEWHQPGDPQYVEQAFHRLQQALGPPVSPTRNSR